MPLHLEKKAIRALGVAESFSRNDEYSTLAGVVMRSDLVIDGFALGRLRVSGSDATDAIISLFEDLGRNDVNALLLSGSVLSLYNVVDVEKLAKKLRLPTIALSFRKSKSDIKRNIIARFPPKEAAKKIRLVERLGEATVAKLETGYPVYVRTAGMSDDQAKKLLGRFTLQGAIPEPIRVARLLAKVVASTAR